MAVVMSQAAKFAQHIATGAAWEISAQTDIASALTEQKGTSGREMKYPDSQQAVDLAFALNGRIYLVELKVESAQNAGDFAGKSMNAAFTADKNKLAGFDLNAFLQGSGLEPGGKWVVVIAYSGVAQAAMQQSGLFARLATFDNITAGIADA